MACRGKDKPPSTGRAAWAKEGSEGRGHRATYGYVDCCYLTGRPVAPLAIPFEYVPAPTHLSYVGAAPLVFPGRVVRVGLQRRGSKAGGGAVHPCRTAAWTKLG